MNLITDLGPSDWAALLTAVALKGTLIFLLAFFAIGLLRRASAATRHAAWTVALAAALVLPALLVIVPSWHVPVLPGAPSLSTELVLPLPPLPPEPPRPPAAPVSPSTVSLAPRVLVVPAAPPSGDVLILHGSGPAGFEGIEARAGFSSTAPGPLPTPLDDWRGWLLLVWAVGAGAVLLRWSLAWFAARRLVQRAPQQPEQQRRRPGQQPRGGQRAGRQG